MDGREQRRSWESQAYWAVLVPAVLAGALVLSALSGSAGARVFLTTFARATAVMLLLGVTWASVQMGHLWRAFHRHDVIRADIAAAGGLGKRLLV